MEDNLFIERYVASMKEAMVKMNPDIDEDSIEKVIRETIQKKIQNPVVILDNNYTHESRETNLVSVLGWIEKENLLYVVMLHFIKTNMKL